MEPGVFPWIWKRQSVPTTGAQGGGGNPQPSPELLWAVSCCAEGSRGALTCECSPLPCVRLPVMVSCISGRSRLLAIHSQLPRPGLSTLLLHLTLVLSLGLSFGSQTQHSTLTLTNRDVSQVGKCMAEVPIRWAEYSPSYLPQTCCYSPFLSSQTPPPSNTLSLLLRRLPKVWETFLLHNSFPSVLVPS